MAAICLGTYALAGGALSLAGWLVDIERLSDWDGDGITIQPNAALVATLTGAGLIALAISRRRVAAILATLVFLLGAATLIEHVTGSDLGIDTPLMLGRTWGRVGVLSPGRMGPPGLASWLLTCNAILLLATGRRRGIAWGLALGATAISILSLLGYLYGARHLYAIPTLTVIASQTASFVFCVSVGLLLLVPEREPMRRLLDPGIAGVLARRVLPVIVALPVLLGLLKLLGERADLYDNAFGTSVLVLTLVVLLVSLLLWSLAKVASRERSLHESEARVRLERERLFDLFEQAPVAVAVYEGHEHRVALYNRRSREFLPPGTSAPRPGQRLTEALPQLQGSALLRTLDEVFSLGEARTVSEQPLRVGPGEERFLTSFYQPLRGLGGETVGVMTASYEVTDEVRLRRVALEASKAKDEFLAMLGHELRNPLAPILTSLELMRMRTPMTREHEVIERQVNHLRRLVDDLLDISRVTSGRLELRRAPMELREAVLSGLEIASPLLEQRAQRVELEVPSEGLRLDGDLDRLAQVVSNLLTNASKYSDTGSTIHVHASRAGGLAQLHVRDQGVGIDPAILDRVFDMFYQQPQTLARSKGGLGLGLAIVRGVVELHGGTVTANSEGPGRGSDFLVELPLASGAEQGIASAPTGAVQRDTRATHAGGKRVLVIDDNVDMAESMADLLAEVGFQSHVVHDGPSALKVIGDIRPDVCLVDIGLPVMDGYELAQQLRRPGCPTEKACLVAVTGYGQPDDRRRAAQAGFDAHLVKPVNIDELLRVIGERSRAPLQANQGGLP